MLLSRRVLPLALRRALLLATVACLPLGRTVAVPPPAVDTTRSEQDLSGNGWHLLLDTKAAWKDDRLQFPTPPLSELPAAAPTDGWDALAGSQSLAVAVPGTVEQYTQKAPGPDGDYVGVSWWTRRVQIPPGAPNRRVLLRFEAARERAEVFVNRRLAGYNVVGSTPFEVDLTDFVTPGQTAELSVRVTDPGGNFDWRDSRPMRWGSHRLPMSHGFGGITGRVRLIVCDPVYVDDLYVQNTPEITRVNAFVTLRNAGDAPAAPELVLRLRERKTGETVAETTLPAVQVKPRGSAVVPVAISAPQASPWSPDDPRLYVCDVSLRLGGGAGDAEHRTFGFRWFDVDGIGKDAVFRLNGKRIVLRTAISWGFWPVNGLFATEELAEKQIRTAKELGLNMLNFHRAIGSPVVLEKADELGLLYYEEPGAFKSVSDDDFGLRIVREKLLRMVRRDRSHPSLVLYNLINEWDSRNPHPNPAEIARHEDAMAAAHAEDPSRLITHTSAWARGVDIEDPAKLHFRPFDSKPYRSGWYDVHHAGGPATWNESLYRNPDDFYGRTENTREIVYWGEEGALSTPPRLEKIEADLSRAPQLGWDGALYREWFREVDAFLTAKDLRRSFAGVDALTAAMGAVSLNHQGRRIENIRMSNVTDGYAINGWESEILENHSGIVDCFRNPKGDPAILAYYNQPLYVAVKLRNTVLSAPGTLVADVFLVNERNLQGRFTLRATLRSADGRELARAERAVSVRGGETYGELLTAGLTFAAGPSDTGALRVEAELIDERGDTRARGRDEAWAVSWRDQKPSGRGAVWENDAQIARFLKEQLALETPAFSSSLGKLDWLVVSEPPLQGQPVAVPASRFRQPGGAGAGLRATFFSDAQLEHPIHQRTDAAVQYAVEDGAAPDPSLSVMSNYGVRWEGLLTPAATGSHVFTLHASGGARLVIGGATVIEGSASQGVQTFRGAVELTAGVAVPIAVELRQARGEARCELSWSPPGASADVSNEILQRVARDGTRLILLNHAELWMPQLCAASKGALRYHGLFKVGRTWLGGVHFAGNHRLLRGLPQDTAMDWPYQALVRNGDERLGLLVDGEEFVAGCYHSYPMRLGTAIGRVPLGNGSVVFSTLDVVANLNASEGPAEAAKKLFCNLLGD